MPDTLLARTATIFTTRLTTLLHLLDKADAEWRAAGRDPETLTAGRLADDMLPLPFQVVFACNQPNDLASWLEGTPNQRVKADAMDLAALRAHVGATIERQSGVVAAADDHLLDRQKVVELGQGMSVELSGRDYIDDWLTPNFYFHVVTAYDVLRHLGVTIGKADYMAHLADKVRRAA